MTVKQEIRRLVDDLREDCTIEDVQYRLYVFKKIRRGLEELDRGEGISEEEARRQLAPWLAE
jgi:predicted transcriptional regulator